MPAEKLNCASWMMNPFCLYIRLVGKLWTWVNAKINSLAAYNYCGGPLLFVSGNTEKSSLISLLSLTQVLGVYPKSGISKIRNSVIAWIPVYVVNRLAWPFPMNIKPSQSVCQIETLSYHYKYVSIFPSASSYIANVSGVRGPSFSDENASLLVVLKKLAQTLRSKIGISHDALQLLIGQRPASVSALSGLRYFIPALSFAQRQTPNVSDGLRLAIYQWASPRLTGFFRPQWGTFSHS